MAGIKVFDRKTNRFYIKQPKLIHIGPLTVDNGNDNDNRELSIEEKVKIKEFADLAEYMGVEFGADSVFSLSKHDIFKIRDEIKDSKVEVPLEKKKYSSIDIIKKQLGIND